jgi:hypothetical protein
VSVRYKKLVARRGALLASGLALFGSLRVNAIGASGYQLFATTPVAATGHESPPPESFELGAPTLEAIAAGEAPEESYSLDLSFPPVPTIGSLAVATTEAPRKPLMFPHMSAKGQKILVGVVSVFAVAGSAYNAFSDKPSHSYHFTSEGWFGRNTYEGGGDKASHFVSYYAVSRLLTSVYETLDEPERQAYTLGSSVAAVAGLATEIGDGTNRYGFSYEDLVMDTAGALSAYVLARFQLNDLITFRAGTVPAPHTPEEYWVPSLGGKDYTKEIYTLDMRLSGLSRRLKTRFGLARFLLVGVTYGVKGYPSAQPYVRERQVGFEIGLDLAEIARGVGMPEDRWWGKIALTILDVIRIPYTAFGWQYDINQNHWHGPSIGDSFQFPGY